ncbi:unnamed protein product, partial [Mesorhabditis spiculigera]
MINTNTRELKAAKKLGYDIKKQVNQCHKLLELDLDGVFRRMLLLKKKKYAALTINLDTEAEKKELKGLDIVRRDWADIAKKEGTKIVDLILDPQLEREELVAAIRDSLALLRARIEAGEVKQEDYEILKQLKRDPEQYGDVKSQPHVSVALRLNSTGRFRMKRDDIVKYIICEDGTANSAIQRAYHSSELDANPALKIDIQYYLANQLHPVISRLCEPIEEADPATIAQALGLDPQQFKRSGHSNQHAHVVEETFDNCEPFKIVCPHAECGFENEITSLVRTEKGQWRLSIESCQKCARSLSFSPDYITKAFEEQLDAFEKLYNAAKYKCDVCETEGEDLKPMGDGTILCPNLDCNDGTMRRMYTPAQLYRQQRFFRQMVDRDGAKTRLTAAQNGCITASSLQTLIDDMFRMLP